MPTLIPTYFWACAYLVIITGCLLLTVDVNSEDGVGPATVFVHIV